MSKCQPFWWFIPMNCEAVKDCLEGDFAAWTLKWTKTDMGYYAWAYSVNEPSRTLFLACFSSSTVWILDLDTGVDKGSVQYAVVPAIGGSSQASLFEKYFAFLDNSGAHLILRIYKDGVDIYDIDMTDLGYSNAKQVLISQSGKYIIVGGDASKYMLFEGS